jgi:hypothetical protein
MATVDHLVYATPDVEASTADIAAAVGVHPVIGGRHLGRGTWNTLLALGGRSYLEIIGPDPDAPAPEGPRPFGVDTIVEPCLVTWAAAVPAHTLDAVIQSSRQRAYDPGDAASMQRRTPDGQLLSWRLTMPTMGVAGGQPGVIPFLLDWLDTADALHPSQTSPHGCELLTLHIGHPSPDEVARALRALDLTPGLSVGPAPRPELVAEISGPHGTLTLR